jgi:hypothetical protein
MERYLPIIFRRIDKVVKQLLNFNSVKRWRFLMRIGQDIKP